MSRQHELVPDDFLVLSWLLSQQPGRVLRLAVRVPKAAKKPGLAEVLGWPRARVNRAVARLRLAGLVIGVIYRHRKNDKFPFGERNVPTTNTLRVFVRVDAIERYKNDPSDGSLNDPSTGSPRSNDNSSYPNPSTRTRRAPRVRTEKASGTPSGDIVDQRPIEQPTAPAAEEPEAVKGKEQEEGRVVDELAKQWDDEKIPEQGGSQSHCRPSERAAIRRALRDLGRERIMLAILGTRADPWLRAGHARSAVAWVFRKGNDGLDYYAKLGAELEHLAQAQRLDAARKRAEALARDDAYKLAERDRLERARRWLAASPEQRKLLSATRNPFLRRPDG